MNEGHFIGLKDMTTCGGVVLDGDIRIMLYGLAHAREGDRVTCGKDGKTYRIVGGVAHIVSHGKPLAGTLDSFSNCPCKAQLIPSVFTATYERQVDPAPGATLGTAQPTTPPATRHSIAPRPSGITPSSNPVPGISPDAGQA